MIKETLPKKFVIGIAQRTSNANFQKDALPLWDKFFREKLAEKILNRLNQNILAVYTEYEGDYTKPYTYLIACEVANLKNVPAAMQGLEIPASSYAVFKATGPFPESMLKTWTSIWNSDLERAYTTDFEIYEPDFNPFNPPKNPEVPIYIATT